VATTHTRTLTPVHPRLVARPTNNPRNFVIRLRCPPSGPLSFQGYPRNGPGLASFRRNSFVCAPGINSLDMFRGCIRSAQSESLLFTTAIKCTGNNSADRSPRTMGSNKSCIEMKSNVINCPRIVFPAPRYSRNATATSTCPASFVSSSTRTNHQVRGPRQGSGTSTRTTHDERLMIYFIKSINMQIILSTIYSRAWADSP
jgi:hypothetical protein